MGEAEKIKVVVRVKPHWEGEGPSEGVHYPYPGLNWNCSKEYEEKLGLLTDPLDNNRYVQCNS